jgi:hypothetical protein
VTGPSITCPRCGRTSYHPGDIEAGYCGSCHWWTSDPAGILNDPYIIAEAEAEGAILPLPTPTRKSGWVRDLLRRVTRKGYSQ